MDESATAAPSQPPQQTNTFHISLTAAVCAEEQMKLSFSSFWDLVPDRPVGGGERCASSSSDRWR